MSYKPNYSTSTITQTPLIEESRLRDLLLNNYGIESCEIINLTGYDDLNFRIENVTFNDRCHLDLKNRNENKFVVKFSNPLEASNPLLMDGQIQLMKHLRDNGIPTAQVVPNVDGNLWKNVNMTDNVILPMRIFTFLPGLMLEKIGYNNTVYELMGELLGNFHNITEKFNHDAYNGFHHFMCFENLKCFEDELNLQIENKILIDEKYIKLLKQGLNDLNNDVLSQKERLKSGFIHSDINETNVLLEKVDDHRYNITGLIDFGDCHYSLLIFDISALIMYMYVDAKINNWKIVAKHVINGYIKTRKIYDVEHILVSMRVRLISSLMYSQRTVRINYRSEDPSYILKMNASGWNVLEKLTQEYNDGNVFKYQVSS